MNYGKQEDQQARRFSGIEGAERQAHEREVEDGGGFGALAARDVEAQEVMALSREDLGRRIERAREEAGLSQTELAQVVDLSQSAVSRIESGSRGVDSLELAGIARALGVAVLDLLETRPLAQQLRVAARAQGVDDTAALERAVDRVVDLIRLDEILVEIGLPREQSKGSDVPPPRTGQKAITQGRELAEAMRVAWDLDDDPLPDLFSLIEDRAGVGVLLEPLEGGLAGLCARTEDIAMVLVDSSAPLGRQRFTASHELCHSLLREGELVLIDEQIAADGALPEMRANAFASNFLMPVDGVLRYVAGREIDETVVAELQFTFGVSLDALLWHLLNLKLITPEQRTALAQGGAKALAYRCGYGSEWDRQEAERDLTRPPRQLAERAIAAYDGGRLGIEVVARLLGRDDAETLRSELEAMGIGDSSWWDSTDPA